MTTSISGMENTATVKAACPRCAGTGNHSFHLMYGTVCFKCNGSGVVMVDPKTQARRKKTSEKRQAEREAKRELFSRVAREVMAEFNVGFNFDLTTELGVDQLNRKVWETTGRTIWQIRDERLKTASA